MNVTINPWNKVHLPITGLAFDLKWYLDWIYLFEDEENTWEGPKYLKWQYLLLLQLRPGLLCFVWFVCTVCLLMIIHHTIWLYDCSVTSYCLVQQCDKHQTHFVSWMCSYLPSVAMFFQLHFVCKSKLKMLAASITSV